MGNIFYDEKGILVVDGYNKYKTYLVQDRTSGQFGDDGAKVASSIDRGDSGTDGHFANFIEAVRKRDKTILNGTVELHIFYQAWPILATLLIDCDVS